MKKIFIILLIIVPVIGKGQVKRTDLYSRQINPSNKIDTSINSKCDTIFYHHSQLPNVIHIGGKHPIFTDKNIRIKKAETVTIGD